ncbi:MAG: NADH:flavin oxidoreductase [Magnetococcales bacterium]|nr:NADH:flavin oxidoreductase [Magnetococcales bacterium]
MSDSPLLQPIILNGLTLPNRLVRSATWEGMCDEEGRPTEKLIDTYRSLALGQVGLIMSGYAFVTLDGKQLPGKMGIHRDDFAPEMTALTQAVHAAGGRICMQLVHAGGQGSQAAGGRRPLAPSAVETAQYSEIPEAMSQEEINRIVAAFGAGAARAKAFGFDGVQLHGAHGYLINQFLSPHTNQRTDGYGGSAENRRRFLMEVYQRVREAVGRDYPVMIKLGLSDFLAEGLSEEEALENAKALDQAGIDAIEVSGGTPASGKQSPARGRAKTIDQEGYHLTLAHQVKQAVSCQVMVVGGFRSLELVERALTGGSADYVSLARPFIREPDLAKRWSSGDRNPATCQSCNGCFKPGLKEGGIYCVKEKMLEARKEAAEASYETQL